MKKNNGFTLVELLAVIIILAIVLVIAVPSITRVINNSTKNAFESDAKMLLKAVDYKLMENETFDISSINAENIETLLKVSDENYQAVQISIEGGKPYIHILGKNKWAGLIAYGFYTDLEVSELENYVNKPKLVSGMTPIKWNGTSWVETNADDSEWYDYTNKEWANAKTADGSMWVWIPRYIYKITDGWHSNIEGNIDIQFSIGLSDTRLGLVTLDTGATAEASNNKWTNHPGFTFGDDELTGIWVAKFEASNDGSNNVKVIPNVSSWRSLNVGESFDKCRDMETNTIYGWGTTGSGIDTHLIKNTEWGAVAYLSKSIYGKNNDELWINPSDNYTTGCTGDSLSSAATSGCLRSYETENGVESSTTGTIYGVYDMNGGAWEKVAAYVDTGNSNLVTYGSSLINTDSKYRDVYTVAETDTSANNYALTINKKGDAVYETSNGDGGTYSWYGDYSYTPYSNLPWFVRGGYYTDGSKSGIFSTGYAIGYYINTHTFRPILLVAEEI